MLCNLWIAAALRECLFHCSLLVLQLFDRLRQVWALIPTWKDIGLVFTGKSLQWWLISLIEWFFLRMCCNGLPHIFRWDRCLLRLWILSVAAFQGFLLFVDRPLTLKLVVLLPTLHVSPRHRFLGFFHSDWGIKIVCFVLICCGLGPSLIKLSLFHLVKGRRAHRCVHHCILLHLLILFLKHSFWLWNYVLAWSYMTLSSLFVEQSTTVRTGDVWVECCPLSKTHCRLDILQMAVSKLLTLFGICYCRSLISLGRIIGFKIFLHLRWVPRIWCPHSSRLPARLSAWLPALSISSKRVPLFLLLGDPVRRMCSVSVRVGCHVKLRGYLSVVILLLTINCIVFLLRPISI